ncbi:MAG TPA: response regulator [bacterium]|nr:response regulator [bacterium]
MALDILIVDDNKDISALLSDIVRMENHHSIVAATGNEAISFIDSRHFDLVFCDITLPDISGWEVVKHLSQVASETSIVIISGLGEGEQSQQGESYTFDMVLKKPFKIDEVQAVLRQFSPE